MHLLKGPHRISTVPRCHHDLTLLQQQKLGATFPATVDFLNECGQVLQALLPPVLQEEELKGQGTVFALTTMPIYVRKEM